MNRAFTAESCFQINFFFVEQMAISSSLPGYLKGHSTVMKVQIEFMWIATLVGISRQKPSANC